MHAVNRVLTRRLASIEFRPPAHGELNWRGHHVHRVEVNAVIPGLRETSEDWAAIRLPSRRAIHNDGSRILMERLKGKVMVDLDTARRLFTLICVLHWKG